MALVDDLGKQHTQVLEVIDGLSAEELTRPDAIGKWSVRDTIQHIAMWEGEVLKALAVWRTGHDYDWSFTKEYLKINDCWIENTRHLTAEQVIRAFNLNHAALMADVAAIPDDIWEKRGGIPKWLQGVGITHTAHHLEKLREYKKSLCK